jgi:hypothetical protein
VETYRWLVTGDDLFVGASWSEALEFLSDEGLVSPAARDMAPFDVMSQVNEVNGGEVEVFLAVEDASFDHGRDSADHVSLLIGQQAAYLMAWALFQGLTGRSCNPSMFGSIDGAFTAATGIETFAGWVEDPDEAQGLYEWSDRLVADCQSAGWVVDTSADAGMTWFYRKVEVRQ